MKSKKVGPYEVHALNVDQGLDLVGMAGTTDHGAFQKAIILRCVTKDGKPINEESFSELMPHLSKLLEEAFAVNGFRSEPEAK